MTLNLQAASDTASRAFQIHIVNTNSSGTVAAAVVAINVVLFLIPRSIAPVCNVGEVETVYYDADDGTVCFCEGGAFRALDGVGACT